MLPGSPRYSLEGRGDPSRRGSRAALEVPVQEEDDAEPPAMPQPGAQSPRGTSVPLVPSSHTTHRLPFGSSKPGRATFPLETLRREKRGAAGGLLRPLPGAVPTGQHSRAERGGRGPGHSPWGSVTSGSPCRPQPARHLRAPGRTRLAPGWAPSTYGTGHVHRAQRPRVAGDAHTETPVTAAGAPPPRAVDISALGGLHGVRSSWHPGHCPGHASNHSSSLVPPAASLSSQGTPGTGDTGDSQEPLGSMSWDYWGRLVR